MIPISIEGQGFYSFKDKFVLDFTGISAAVVMGPNGAGKSTVIVDAIKFAFWGDSRDDIADVIHDDADECWIAYTFENNNHVYTVTRTAKRKGSGSLSLKEDGKNYEDRLKRTNKESLVDILGANLTEELLFSTCVSQQDDANAFSDMGTAKREQVITTLLNLDIWKQKATQTSNFIKENKDIDSILSERRQILELKETDCKLVDQQIVDSTNKIVDLEIQHNKQQLYYNQLLEANKEDEINQSIQRELAKLSGVVATLGKSIKILPKKSFILDCNITIKKDIDLVDDHINRTKMEATAAFNLVQKLQSLKNDAVNLIAAQATSNALDIVPCFNTPFYTSCPLLDQAHNSRDQINMFLSDYGKGSLKEVLNDIQLRLDHANQTVRTCSDEANQLGYKRSGLNEVYQSNLQLIKDIDANDLIIKQYNEKKALLDEYSKELKPVNNASTLDQEREKLFNIASVLSNERSALNQLKTYQNSLLKECQTLKDEILHLKEKSQKLIKYKVLDQAYKDIPALLFANTIPQIESYANNLLSQIMPGWVLQLRTHRETQKNTQKKSLDLICVTPTGSSRKFASLSGSEKFRISLILRLAIAWVNSELYNIPLDFFIVDEGFGSLHGDNYDGIKSMLRYIAPFFKLILIITHIDELKDTFDTQIIVNPDGAKERIVILQ